MQNKELIVRKRMSAFLEKALRYCGYEFRHDDYKQIVYGESGCKTPLEDKIKSLYDAYSYLLSNAKNPLSTDILKKFFYLLEEKEADESMLIRIASKFFHLNDMPPIEKATDFHMTVYSELAGTDEEKRFIVPLMFLNYAFVKGGIPILRFVSPVLKDYISCRQSFLKGEKHPLYQLMLQQVLESKYQDKNFYKNLKPLSTKDIFERILQDKSLLQQLYGVKSVSIFGSFAKNMQRIDSDIDLIIVFTQDISFEKKMQNTEILANHYFTVFNRFIDFTEVSEFVGDWIIKEISNYKKIF